MPFAIKPGQTVLFIGDSITDCDRRGGSFPFGAGYVRIIRDLIVARYPGHQLNIINKGISGNTVRDLAHRWTDDCIRFQPDWVSLMIGINDIHRWLMNIEGASVTAEQFAELYSGIMDRLRKETKARIILIDPFYMSQECSADSFRHQVLRHLPSYLKTVDQMAKQHKTYHVKLHAEFQSLLKRYEADQFCPEPVHPNPAGHTVMAHAWLKALGW
ncbi:MAG: SGNH/GDSL hydrolase family protein [Phycisphaeraceae bacterium]|nr:SGNH/GDSL hydrolase family protein [Phycisphaeraceae bacterium]